MGASVPHSLAARPAGGAERGFDAAQTALAGPGSLSFKDVEARTRRHARRCVWDPRVGEHSPLPGEAWAGPCECPHVAAAGTRAASQAAAACEVRPTDSE